MGQEQLFMKINYNSLLQEESVWLCDPIGDPSGGFKSSK